MPRLHHIIGWIDRVLIAIAVILTLLSALFLFFSLLQSLREMRRDLALFRALGATRKCVMGLILSEAMVISILGGLQRILTEYKRFFRHPGEIAYSLFFIFLFWVQRERIVGNNELKHVFVYFLILVVSLGAIAPAKTDYYLLYHMPYVAIIVSALFRQSIARSRQPVLACSDSTLTTRRRSPSPPRPSTPWRRCPSCAG